MYIIHTCQQVRLDWQTINENKKKCSINKWNSFDKSENVNYCFLLRIKILGLCLKCWECRSDSDPKCADPFDNSTLSITDCKQVPSLEHLPGVRPTMCRKIRQKGKNDFICINKLIIFLNFVNFFWNSKRRMEIFP